MTTKTIDTRLAEILALPDDAELAPFPVRTGKNRKGPIRWLPVRVRDVRRLLKYADIRDTSECVEWTGGSKSRTGHGRLTLAGATVPAHRLARHLLIAPLTAEDADRLAAHNCFNAGCANPLHTRLTTTSGNQRDDDCRGPSGVLGVSPYVRKARAFRWQANHRVDGRKIHAGMFGLFNKFDAELAAIEARITHGTDRPEDWQILLGLIPLETDGVTFIDDLETGPLKLTEPDFDVHALPREYAPAAA